VPLGNPRPLEDREVGFIAVLVWSNMKSRMPNSHTLLALLLSGAAVGAQEIQPVIDRPLTLPKGRLDLTLHGTYTATAGPASTRAPAH